MGTYCFLCFVAAVIGSVLAHVMENRARAKMSPSERTEADFGPLNPKLVCPHCQTTGQVRTKPIEQKKGVSGGKATAAVPTAGVSMLATGLSRKETNTQAHCMNCKSR